MRISDWSSDVCSSDLQRRSVQAACGARLLRGGCRLSQGKGLARSRSADGARYCQHQPAGPNLRNEHREGGLSRAVGADTCRCALIPRSEEGGVGKECVRTGRFRWWSDNSKKQNTNNTYIISEGY